MRTLTLVAVAIAAAAALHASPTQRINKRGPIVAGETVPILRGFGLDSKPVVVDYRTQGKPTVVYVIDEHGGAFVKSNEANFAALVKQAAARYAFVVLCPEDTGSLAGVINRMRPAWGKTPVTVIANVSESLRQDLSLFFYPQTMIVSTEARVLENFRGAYTRGSWNAQPAVVERFFGVKLPETDR